MSFDRLLPYGRSSTTSVRAPGTAEYGGPSPLQATAQDKDEDESENDERELPRWRKYKECITCRTLHKSVAVRNGRR
jgi:hypothetical protein